MNQIIAVDRVFGWVRGISALFAVKKSFFFIGFMKFLLYLHRESVSNDNLAHRCKL